MSDEIDELSSYHHYTFCLIPEPRGGFSCYVLELPGCMSDGDTAQEAYDNLCVAMRNWTDSMTAAGKPIPRPRGQEGWWPR